MYPCLDVIKEITNLDDAYLNVMIPIIGQDALDKCNCECDTGVSYLAIDVLDKDVWIEELSPTINYVSEYFSIDNKIYCVKEQINEIHDSINTTKLTFDENVISLIAPIALTLLDIPKGLIIPIANEITRNSVDGVKSESTGNASITYGTKSNADFGKDIGRVSGCESTKKGMVFV